MAEKVSGGENVDAPLLPLMPEAVAVTPKSKKPEEEAETDASTLETRHLTPDGTRKKVTRRYPQTVQGPGKRIRRPQTKIVPDSLRNKPAAERRDID